MIRLKPTLTCILIIYFIDMIQGFDIVGLDDIGNIPQHEDSIIANKLSLLVKRLVTENYKTRQFGDRKKPSQFEYYGKKAPQFEYYGKKPPQFEYDRKNSKISTNKASLTKKWISRGKIPQFEYDRKRINPVISTNVVSLVKRLVPRGYKTPQFEYDRKFKSIFVPKYRVHRQRPVNNGKVFTELYELFYKPMFYKIRPGISKQARQIDPWYKKLLRQSQPEYDPVGSKSNRPVYVNVKDKEDDKPSKQFNFPHFSLYNFWTYDKSVLQDMCPPHQAQLGHKCIYAPMAVDS